MKTHIDHLADTISNSIIISIGRKIFEEIFFNQVDFSEIDNLTEQLEADDLGIGINTEW